MKESIELIQKELDELYECRKDYEESLNTLYLPFNNIQKTLNLHPQYVPLEKSKRRIPNISSTIIPEEHDFFLSTKSKPILLFTFFLLLLSFFISFNRVIFYDIFIYCLYIALSFRKKLNSSSLKLCIVSLIFSIIIDMSWMIIFSEVDIFENNIIIFKKHYWSPTSTNLMTSVYEKSLNQFIVVMSYIVFILKVVITPVYFYEFKNFFRLD